MDIKNLIQKITSAAVDLLVEKGVGQMEKNSKRIVEHALNLEANLYPPKTPVDNDEKAEAKESNKEGSLDEKHFDLNGVNGIMKELEWEDNISGAGVIKNKWKHILSRKRQRQKKVIFGVVYT